MALLLSLLWLRGLSFLPDPGHQGHLDGQGLEKRAGLSPDQAPHLAATDVGRLELFSTSFPSSPRQPQRLQVPAPWLGKARERLTGAPGFSHTAPSTLPGHSNGTNVSPMVRKEHGGPEDSRVHGGGLVDFTASLGLSPG